MSESDPLAAALVAAQRAIRNPALDGTNPHFHSKYATLAATLASVLPPLNAQGISVLQPASVTADGIVTVTTILLHSSGASRDYAISARSGTTVQQLGSTITYLRRYALSSLLGIVGEEDDDGNAAQGAKTNSIPDPPKRARAPKSVLGGDRGAPAPDGFDRVVVRAVEILESKTGKKFYRTDYTLSSGVDERASTFNATIGERLQASIGQTAMIRVETKDKDGKTFTNIMEVI